MNARKDNGDSSRERARVRLWPQRPGARRTQERAPETATRGRLQRVKRERFLPYPYERAGIAIRVASCLDEQRRLLAEPDIERHLIELDDRPWRSVALDLCLTVTAGLVERLLPESERERPPLRLLLTVRCPATRLRLGFVVANTPFKPGAYRHALKLARADIAGTVEIDAFLVLTESIEALYSKYAAHSGGRVASSRPWQLCVEPRAVMPGHFLDVRYRSFDQDALLKQYQANLYRLECDQESPVLWVNADQEKIAAILGDRGTVGRRARMRELFYDVIAYGVWTLLFTRAARHLEDGELVYAWEEAVLRELLPFIFPQKRDHAARLRALTDLLRYGDWPLLMERLDAALQAKCASTLHMANLVEETIERETR
ncbi:MAG: hypothetical protein JXA30_15105 [Deltaproteobacteria bacterium]|nr:hypothetical protein [Deltaproteobacteria bacterium]